MVERGILPAQKMRGSWQFRAGGVWNWIDANMHGLPDHRKKDKHPPEQGDLLIAEALREKAVAVDIVAKTKSSVLRELVRLQAAFFISVQEKK